MTRPCSSFIRYTPGVAGNCFTFSPGGVRSGVGIMSDKIRLRSERPVPFGRQSADRSTILPLVLLPFFLRRAQLARGWPSAAAAGAGSEDRHPDYREDRADASQDCNFSKRHGKPSFKFSTADVHYFILRRYGKFKEGIPPPSAAVRTRLDDD